MVTRWKLIDEREGSAGYLTRRRRAGIALPDGTQGEWDIFGPEQTVAVVAITPGGEVVLARQYRPGPDTVLDEIPGGAVEAGEDVAAAARRELLEETGYSGTVEVIAQTWLSGARAHPPLRGARAGRHERLGATESSGRVLRGDARIPGAVPGAPALGAAHRRRSRISRARSRRPASAIVGPMNRAHMEFCSSPEWRTMIEEQILPPVLARPRSR